MNKRRAFFIILILCIGLFLSFFKIPVLILEHRETSEILLLERVSPGAEFTIRWMHSVELQPWEEIFRIDEEYRLVLDRTRFKSFGAGVPHEAGKKSEIKDGYVIFSDINTIIPEITYGISDYAKHTFIYNTHELPLYQLVNDGDGIKFYIEKAAVIDYLLKRKKVKNSHVR